ncbi:MAG: Hsp70 family protein [Alphaproteobacteria bacterium]|nr:Hsp70 family protein [Alphaproteobacteria bacterium]MCB9690409.1 Hsp70 family protein [Alphaproteobacteria bacterium]
MTTGAVGIDLGTTFSAIAHVNQHGVPEILPNLEGDRITPSVILFEDGEPIVGTYAKQAAVVYPEQVVEFVKRYMGDDKFRFEYDGKSYTPEQLSSFILAKLKHDAELRLGHRVEQAVITVPAYFTDVQRRLTLAAGEMAGLQVLKLINEPTAAAFAYGLNNMGQNAKVLVYDLGGGTFDVTLVDIADREINVIATNGDHILGGKDWDDRLIEHVAQAFIEKHGLDPRDDLASYHDLRAKCVSAKISLTRRPKVNVFHDYGSKVLRLAVTRETFEELTKDLLDRADALTVEVLRDAGVEASAVDTVLLAGGSTRMPMVRDSLTRIFGKAPATDINPDEAVALGAALTAAIESAALAGEESPVDIRTHDVTSHSLGMVVYREGALFNSRIIQKNTRIPAEKTREDYSTTHDGQTTVDLWLVQGEDTDPLKCTVLGHFEFYGIPPRPAGEARLAVTYRYNANGIVEVEAMDLETGQILPHRLAAGQVTLEDLAHNRAPMQVALVMDCSGSMYGKNISEAKAAALGFAERTLSSPNRQIAMVAFPGGVKSTPTNDMARIKWAIDSLTPIGSTPMSEGLYDARNLLRPRAGVQRVFVVMTDGHPDDPDGTVAEIHRLRSTGARVITIGVGSEVDKDFLASLASGPSDFHFCNEALELEGTFINLATQLAGD